MGRSTIRGNVTRFAAQVPQAEAAGIDYVLVSALSSHTIRQPLPVLIVVLL